MAIEFNGSKKNRELEALDLLLKGKSDEYKGRVYDYVRNAKVDANDPTFLLMAALGNLDVALVDLPKAIEASGEKSSAEISKMITDLRTMFQLAAKQAQEQIDTIDDTEGRIKTQLDTFEVRVNETLAALKRYRDDSYKILKLSKESYQKIVNDSHTQNQLLLTKVEKLGKQLEKERDLRMSKPWKNAVNLPPLMLTRHRRIWAERFLSSYLHTRWESEILEAGRVHNLLIHEGNGKAPTLKKFAKSAVTATNHWFGGNISSLYGAIREKSPIQPERFKFMPEHKFEFAQAVYQALSESSVAELVDINGGMRYLKIELANLSLNYIQIEEASGREPKIDELGIKNLKYYRKKADFNIEKIYDAYSTILLEVRAKFSTIIKK